MSRRTRTFAVAIALGGIVILPAGATARAAKPRGIDVSRFQDRVNWKRVGASKVRFAFVQASRGSGDDCAVVPRRCGPDEDYARNYAGASDHGVSVGAYHRAFPGGGGRKAQKRDAKSEANVFIREVGKVRRGDLRPALDVETPFGGLGEQALRRWVRTWLARVKSKLGEEAIIYTNASSWRATGNTTVFAQHPLWVANYGVRTPRAPASNWGGRGWSVWQYTSSGHVPGIDGKVDRNRLRGGLDPLRASG